MDLRTRLKNETQHLHDQVEALPLFKKLVEQTITLKEYQLLLEKFYGFIAPQEEIFNHLSLKFPIKDREKTSLLEKDLISLGRKRNTLSSIIRCQLSFHITCENLLGYLYVIEGSTLGGQVITRILSKHLSLSPDYGACFFYGYGKKTKEKWDEYCALLNKVEDTAQQESIIQSAHSTYHAFYDWLSKILTGS